VLVPTRELAGQVAGELTLLTRGTKLRVTTVYGGVGFGPQRNALRRGVDILVACPGRLADLIGQGDVVLDDVAIAVVDEADRMADMGFLPEVRRLLDQTRPDRQTLLFSATLDGAVDVLVQRYQRDPVRHEVRGADDDAARATHLFWRIDESDRVAVCAQVVDAAGPTVVFCRTRHRADRIAKRLSGAGVSAAAIHGGRSQGQRDRALEAFRQGRVAALVATDVAARGIHVDAVAAVVHFDPPADPKDYVHRSGRTARAGAAGVVISLVGPAQRKDATKLRKAAGVQADLTDPDVRVLRRGREAANRMRYDRKRRRNRGRAARTRPTR
jgi:superfamily II DNA/RNA helicase